MTELKKHEGVNLTPEVIRGTEYFNFSGRRIEEAISWFPHDLRADRIILLPDLCPGRSPLPTGCCVEISESVQPEWRKFAISDVGCGMQVLKAPGISWDDFEDNRGAWDEVYRKLKANKGKLGDLGSGNHFLDATVDPEEGLYFVVHTGSRDESPKATEHLGNPRRFDDEYTRITGWAKDNRDAIAEVLRSVYGKVEPVFDKTHNFYERGRDGKAIIYKGAVKLEPDDLTVIPSSMDGQMVIVSPKSPLLELNSAMSHGTGRIKSRSESKEDAANFDYQELRRKIYIPEGIGNSSIKAENPSCYRRLDDCLGLISDLVEEEERLSPIAYIGQI